MDTTYLKENVVVVITSIFRIFGMVSKRINKQGECNEITSLFRTFGMFSKRMNKQGECNELI